MDRLTACIITNFNRKDDTVKCVNSLLKDPSASEIIVVDNASSDQNDLQKELAGRERIHFIPLDKNTGFTGGNNKGFEYVLNKNIFSYVFLINNDAWIIDNAVSKLADFLDNSADISMASPKIYFSDHKTIWSAGGRYNYLRCTGSNIGYKKTDSEKYNKQKKITFASACALMMRENTLRDVGLFDDNLFAYYEDFDFCLRAIKKGRGIHYYPASVVLHSGSSTAGGRFSSFVSYYRCRNRLIILKKHGDILQILFNTALLPALFVKETLTYILSMKIRSYLSFLKGIYDFITD